MMKFLQNKFRFYVGCVIVLCMCRLDPKRSWYDNSIKTNRLIATDTKSKFKLKKKVSSLKKSNFLVKLIAK